MLKAFFFRRQQIRYLAFNMHKRVMNEVAEDSRCS